MFRRRRRVTNNCSSSVSKRNGEAPTRKTKVKLIKPPNRPIDEKYSRSIIGDRADTRRLVDGSSCSFLNTGPAIVEIGDGDLAKMSGLDAGGRGGDSDGAFVVPGAVSFFLYG